MIKNYRLLEKLERAWIKKEPINITRNFKLFEAMYEEARALGIFPPKDPLEGIEIDIKIAKVVNAISKSA